MDRTDRYQEKDSPGRVIIINNFDYNDPRSTRSNRRLKRVTSDGSLYEQKGSNLEKVFRDLNFRGIKNDGKNDVMVVNNYTKAQLQELMKNVKSNDLKDDYCFICVIMSYGEPGLITCVPSTTDEHNHVKTHPKPANSMDIPIADLLDELKGEGCPALVGRPKIFLVQTQPWPTDTADDLSERRQGQEDTRNTIPREADFLVHAVCENQDYVVDAWVAGLKDCNEKNKQMDINTFLIRCNDEVRKEYIKEKCKPLVPCVTSLLTKKMYINYRASEMITNTGTYSSGQGLAIMICNFIHEENEEDNSKYETVHGEDYRKKPEHIGKGVSKPEWVYKSGIKPRVGADRDVENMKDALGKLGYKVDIYRNQTKMEMEGLLKEAAKKYNNYKSFALVISSHGSEIERKESRLVRHDAIVTFDEKGYLIKDITEVFNDGNSTLMTNGVPKLFFIQACRLPSSQHDQTDSVDGTETPRGIDPGYSTQKGRRNNPKTDDDSNTGPTGVNSSDALLDVVGTRTTPQDLPLTLTNIPCYNDMLLMFASPQGFFALRNPLEGSFLLRELANEIKKNCKDSSQQINLIQLLTNISYNMSAKEIPTMTIANTQCKPVLVPSIVHSLVKDVVFMPHV